MSEDQDIRSVRLSEEVRGKRVIDPELIELKKRRVYQVNALLEEGDRGVFLMMLTDDYGLLKGSTSYRQAVQAYDDHWKKKQRL